MGCSISSGAFPAGVGQDVVSGNAETSNSQKVRVQKKKAAQEA
jgi:hypothetical protein